MDASARRTQQRELNSRQRLELDLFRDQARGDRPAQFRAADEDLRHERLTRVLSRTAGHDEREHNEKRSKRHPVLKMDAEEGRLADEPR